MLQETELSGNNVTADETSHENEPKLPEYDPEDDEIAKSGLYCASLLAFLLCIIFINLWYQTMSLTNELEDFDKCGECLNVIVSEPNCDVFIPTCYSLYLNLNNTEFDDSIAYQHFDDGFVGMTGSWSYKTAMWFVSALVGILGFTALSEAFDLVDKSEDEEQKPPAYKPILTIGYLYAMMFIMFPMYLEVNQTEMKSFNNIECPSLTLSFDSKRIFFVIAAVYIVANGFFCGFCCLIGQCAEIVGKEDKCIDHMGPILFIFYTIMFASAPLFSFYLIFLAFTMGKPFITALALFMIFLTLLNVILHFLGPSFFRSLDSLFCNKPVVVA